MVIFACTREGYFELDSKVLSSASSVWIGAGVLSEAEVADILDQGVNLTCFDYAIAPTDFEQIQGALQTISEHHPGERIWLEFQAAN